jgi:hypothetical protein
MSSINSSEILIENLELLMQEELKPLDEKNLNPLLLGFF